MGEGDQGREHQGELSGRKHSALERCVVQHSKIWRPMSAMGQNPLFPQKRTSAECIGMSVKGQNRTSRGATYAIINMTYLMPLAACSIRSVTKSCDTDKW